MLFRSEWSHCLRPELSAADSSGAALTVAFIPEASRSQALQTFQSYFVEEVYLDWLTSISTVPYLEAELAEIPAAFEKLYVCRRSIVQPSALRRTRNADDR